MCKNLNSNHIRKIFRNWARLLEVCWSCESLLYVCVCVCEYTHTQVHIHIWEGIARFFDVDACIAIVLLQYMHLHVCHTNIHAQGKRQIQTERYSLQSPIYSQKSPIYPQNISPQKSSISPQKSPISPLKSALVFEPSVFKWDLVMHIQNI